MSRRPIAFVVITALVCAVALLGLSSCARLPEAPLDAAAWAAHGPLEATVVSLGEEWGEGEALQSLEILAPQSPQSSELGVASVYYDKLSVTVAQDIMADYASPDGELPIDGLLLMDAKVRIELERRGNRWWARSVFIEQVGG